MGAETRIGGNQEHCASGGTGVLASADGGDSRGTSLHLPKRLFANACPVASHSSDDRSPKGSLVTLARRGHAPLPKKHTGQRLVPPAEIGGNQVAAESRGPGRLTTPAELILQEHCR